MNVRESAGDELALDHRNATPSPFAVRRSSFTLAGR